MKTTQIVLIAIAVLLFAACAGTKKSIQPQANAVSATKEDVAKANVPIVAIAPAKHADGIYAPGSEELTAIKAQYSDVTLDKLTQGYVLYSQGACVNCHSAQAIYNFTATDWKGIIDDMANKAQLSVIQKDAVYKYVLSIKATQKK